MSYIRRTYQLIVQDVLEVTVRACAVPDAGIVIVLADSVR